jgi:dipeptide/tripeptide permease
MAGPFQSQACQMNTWVGSVQLNAAFFNIADCIAIIVFVPILEKIVYPLIGRMKGSPVTLKQKLVAGLAVAGLSMVVAAGLEYLRRGMPLVQPKGTVPTPECCLYGMLCGRTHHIICPSLLHLKLRVDALPWRRRFQ